YSGNTVRKPPRHTIGGEHLRTKQSPYHHLIELHEPETEKRAETERQRIPHRAPEWRSWGSFQKDTSQVPGQAQQTDKENGYEYRQIAPEPESDKPQQRHDLSAHSEKQIPARNQPE